MQIGNCTQAFDGIIYNDIRRTLTTISRSRYYLILNISENGTR